MPYINEKDRKTILEGIYHPETPGELNFIITKECLAYLNNTDDKISYQRYNDIIGALEACKLEFYRRSVSVYENEKIKENGDVY